MQIHHRLAIVALVAFSGIQPASAEEFPDGATVLPTAEITQRFAGKIFTVKVRDNATWRIEYHANGYFFFNHSNGFSDTGEWNIQNGKLCSKGRKINASCNEVRLKDDILLLKRDNGDVVQFVEKK
jgi:hypothetical protein